MVVPAARRVIIEMVIGVDANGYNDKMESDIVDTLKRELEFQHDEPDDNNVCWCVVESITMTGINKTVN